MIYIYVGLGSNIVGVINFFQFMEGKGIFIDLGCIVWCYMDIYGIFIVFDYCYVKNEDVDVGMGQ